MFYILKYTCYNVWEKREGYFLECKINWKLFNNGQVVIDLKDIFIEKKDSKFIYKDKDGENTIDLENKVYERKLNDVTMKINFVLNQAYFKFSNGEECTIDIISKLVVGEKEIKLEYQIDDEIKMIVIEMV